MIERSKLVDNLVGSNAESEFAEIHENIVPVCLGGARMRCAKKDEATVLKLYPVELGRLRIQSPHRFTSYQSSLDLS